MKVYKSGKMVRVESPTTALNDTDSFSACSLKRVRLGLTGLTVQERSNVVLRIGNYDALDNMNNIQNEAGVAFATLNEALDYLDETLCFEVGGGGDLEQRVTDLENQTVKLTYFELIDISTSTTGTIPQPATTATLSENSFGVAGNAIESTLTINNKPTFIEAYDGSGNDIIIELQPDWTYSSNLLYPDPLALIFQIELPTIDQSQLNTSQIIDYYQKNNGTGGELWKKELFINPSNGQTLFVLSDIPNVNTIQFKINGQVQNSIVDYTTSSTIISYLNNGFEISNEDIIEIIYST